MNKYSRHEKFQQWPFQYVNIYEKELEENCLAVERECSH